MTDYLLPLRHRQEVARSTMAFWFDTLRSGYTLKAGQNADFILIDPPQTDGGRRSPVASFCRSSATCSASLASGQAWGRLTRSFFT